MHRRAWGWLAIAVCCVAPAWAGAAEAQLVDVRSRVREYRERHEIDIVRELADLLSIPNLASDSVNIRRNADRIVSMLERRGVRARLLELPGSPPAVLGGKSSPVPV